MRKIISTMGKTFEVDAYLDFDNSMMVVDIYEVVRPNWKFFRTSFFPFAHGAFWLSDHPTIEEGIATILDQKFAKITEYKINQKKFEEYMNST